MTHSVEIVQSNDGLISDTLFAVYTVGGIGRP